MKAAFTRHAWTRVLDRLSLGPGEVAQLLDWDLCVNVGVEPGTPREHRLFYSVPDRQCFVAIQDHRNGAVVTVLPVDFHATIAWHVTVEAQVRAEQLARGGRHDGEAPGSRDTQIASAQRGSTAQFRISAYAVSWPDTIRGVNLGTWPSAPYARRLELLIEDDRFFDEITRRLIARGVEAGTVECVYVRLGKSGQPVRINWRPASTEPAVETDVDEEA